MKKAKLVGILSLALLLAGCGDVVNSSSEGKENSSSETSESSSANASSSSESSSGESSSESDHSSSEDSSSSQDSSSSSSSSQEEDKSISLEDALSEISKLQKEELNNAASVQYKKVEGTSVITNTTEETYTNYLDGSTTSVGTYKRDENGTNKVNDTFKSIATSIEETYEDAEDSSKTNVFNMFVKVTGYEKEWNNGSAYKDSASKVFIVNTEEEATEAGLSSGQYILYKDLKANASANLSSKLYNFIAGNISESIYAQQAGISKVTPVALENGDIYYCINCNYSYNEDGEKVETTIKAEYTLNKEKTRLLTYGTSLKVNYSRIDDESDSDYSLIEDSGTITYGTKADGFGSDVLDPEDYFLNKVSSINLKVKDHYWNISDVKDNTVSESNLTIYGYAKDYLPTKTLDTQLTAYASSDESVIKVDDQGNFEIVGEGAAELTFCYYAKRESTGAYYLATIKSEEITVSAIKITSIKFSSTSDIGNRSASLLTGQEYTWRYTTEPSKAIGEEVVATSSSDSKLAVEVIGNGEIKLIGKGQGEVTITLSSKDDPTVTTSKTFYVIKGNTNFVNFLTNEERTFALFNYPTSYGYTAVSLKFATDGTCTRTITYSNGSTGEDTFSWELVGNEFEFDDFSSDFKNWEEGRIGMMYENGQQIGLGLTLECGEPDNSTMYFKQVNA